MKARKLRTQSRAELKREKFFAREIWYAIELGLKPSDTHSAYRLNFSKVYPLWFRDVVKRFIYLQANTKAYYTCCSYITGLRHFGKFITIYNPNITPEQINRAVIIDYLSYLNTLSIKTVARQMALIHLRTFLEIVGQEEWLPITKTRLIYSDDLPKPPSSAPRFIPEIVMSQFNRHLNEIPAHYRRLIYLLQETGRRISEICALPYDCLHQDDDRSYFLKVTEYKTKKSYLIPITDECAKMIKEQQYYLINIKRHDSSYLFVGNSKNSPHATARIIHDVLNDLARKKQIRDSDGKIWHFSSHQFRHTVGTRMINAGVSQPIVQRYLGHESPEMTSRYAYIHDRTLKKAFLEFQGNLVDVYGETTIDHQTRSNEEQWLKQNIMAQALPNGYCGLPAKQERCPHANACLTCTSFRTDASFLPQHERQLHETNAVLETAKKYGWQRQISMNQEVKINLETIIASLRGKKHESA